jgi:hypothetical protein
MANELERMREIRIEQKNVRISLKKREEQNKSIRAKITPMWDNPTKEYEVYQLSKELIKGRAKTKNYQKLLREFKVNLRETNRSYDLSKSE